MSILSVANVHFESTGANRIDYNVANDFLNIVTTGNISITSRNFTISDNPGFSGNVLTSNGTSWVSQAIPTELPGTGASGNVLTSNGTSWVSQAPVAPVVTAQPGSFGNILTSNGTNWISAPARANTIAISTDTNASPGNYYVATAILTLTLPGSPAVGDIVGFSNPTINTTSNISRNGANIMGLAENLQVNKANAAVVLQYSGADKGWVFV